MYISVKNTLTSNICLKAAALIIGYALWSIIGETFPTTRWFSVPVYFYNIEQTRGLKAPETLWVQLKGKRSFLNFIDKEKLGIHIDAHDLKPGLNTLNLTAEHLLLPPALALSHYIPHNIIITVEN
jgi:hypothetical protein